MVVVAEGAIDGAIDLKLDSDGEKDKGGHVKHADIGVHLKSRIPQYFKEKGVDVTLKYIDPTYAIRGGPAIAPCTAA